MSTLPPQARPHAAKLTRPRVYGALARPRLFGRLDEVLRRPAVWVCGPPGAGKTTLVANYLDDRDLATLWYQVDQGDVDVATLFHYLIAAALPFQRAEDAPLPHFETIYAGDVAGFARRFFREFFGRLPTPCVIVLDNYQEAPTEAALHAVLATALNEMPAGQSMILISRAAPPIEMARFIANDQLSILGWEDLRLDAEEVRAIVGDRIQMAPEETDLLCARSGGWAAGVTLLIEQHRAGGSVNALPGQGLLFDYFASEIFDRAAARVQHVLLRASSTPFLTAGIANALAEDDGAGDILEDLYRRGLFVQRKPAPAPLYQLHALFREFLQTRAASRDRDAVMRAAHRAGELLAQDDMEAEACVAWRESHSWDDLEALVLRAAARLMTQGRARTLQDWIVALPPERVARSAPLQYWLGLSLAQSDTAQARQWLDAAHEHYKRTDDKQGALLAACAQVELIYFEWSDFRPLVKWIKEIEAHLAAGVRFLSPAMELRVTGGLMIAMLYALPAHADLDRHSRRVESLLDDVDVDMAHRRVGATFLVSYLSLARDLPRCARVVELASPWFEQADTTPSARLWWHTRLGFYYYLRTEFELAEQHLSRTHEIADNFGLRALRAANALVLSYQIMNDHGLADYRAIRTRVHAVIREGEGSLRAMSHWHALKGRADKALGEDDYGTVLDLGEDMLAAAERSGMIYLEVLAGAIYGYALVQCGEWGLLDTLLTRMSRTIDGTCYAHWNTDFNFMRARALLAHGDRKQGLALLKSTLARSRREGYAFMFFFANEFFTRTCAIALEHHVEADYVAELITRYRLRGTDSTVLRWPWAVRVHTLGRFEVQVRGETVEFAGKAPRKVLSLLKAIAAFGGDKVPERQIMDALWPQDDADSALKSLGVALTRLRKLLDNTEAVIREEQRLSLDPTLCWLDLWALRAFVSRESPRICCMGAEESLRSLDTLTRIYAGVFLPDDGEDYWTITARERGRSQFIGFVEQLGQHLETGDQWQAAVACYRRGLDVDDLNEALYRGLMRSLRAMDRSADAMAAFRRMRQTLSVVLGIKPSPESESLALDISRERRIP